MSGVNCMHLSKKYDSRGEELGALRLWFAKCTSPSYYRMGKHTDEVLRKQERNKTCFSIKPLASGAPSERGCSAAQTSCPALARPTGKQLPTSHISPKRAKGTLKMTITFHLAAASRRSPLRLQPYRYVACCKPQQPFGELSYSTYCSAGSHPIPPRRFLRSNSLLRPADASAGNVI